MTNGNFEMHESRPAGKTDVICHCSGTTGEKIRALVGRGIGDLEHISRLTGVCAGCGACERAVSDLLAELGGRPDSICPPIIP
ncbi:MULTISPECIES: (2Fe-2S)-binding protein [Methylomicrobium]|uniref:Bacterioferritin-associated ferredoxin n=1 Tax=Methylomicrobium album BG8 TaxID=686340 RepID=H8GPV3_METAL|nr:MULTISPECIES: (2Fe-2S)-binding protein [Methylomicrobium]EIC29732.1 bacterioferritin-associated ferredoxin [Methylomicrobium album BG8]